MSDREGAIERPKSRSRRQSPSSPRSSRSPSPRRQRSRSRSPYQSRPSPLSSTSTRRHRTQHGRRKSPQPSSILGIFGLAAKTTEKDIRDLFDKHASVKEVQLVIDKRTQKSRGFAFIYFDDISSAARAKKAVESIELDGRCVRVDYSTTKRPHKPTPGVYMGERPARFDHRSFTHIERTRRRFERRSRSRTRTRSRTPRHRSRRHRSVSRTRS